MINLTNQLAHIVISNSASHVNGAKFSDQPDYRSFCSLLHREIKFLSELLTCLHFSTPEHPLRKSTLDSLRSILLHQFTLNAVRSNPLLVNWLMNAIALLQDDFDLSYERKFANTLIDNFGIHCLDAPAYRLEENLYLHAKMEHAKYTPTIDCTFFNNFYRLSRDQVYALTHLLFYVSDYGSKEYASDLRRSFALEFLVYEAYLNHDVDVMLELMLVYLACEQSEVGWSDLFEKLLIKLVRADKNLYNAMTRMDSQNFSKYYHQCLLAVMYSQARKRSRKKANSAHKPTVHELHGSYLFHVSLRSGNFVKAAQSFTCLVELDSERRSFCKANLDKYLAAHRMSISVPKAIVQSPSRSS